MNSHKTIIVWRRFRELFSRRGGRGHSTALEHYSLFEGIHDRLGGAFSWGFVSTRACDTRRQGHVTSEQACTIPFEGGLMGFCLFLGLQFVFLRRELVRYFPGSVTSGRH